MTLPTYPLLRSRRGWRRVAAAAGALGALAPAMAAPPVIPALSPEEALRAFRVEPGMRVELVAAEPLVVDPVAFAFDERGRLYVAENRGYPGAVKGDQSQPDAAAVPEGRIALLEDRDGDGRYETRREFAAGLTYPNGLTPWRGGVFVTCAPDILYLKDNDGDGVADERRVVLTGFSTSRTTQIRTSHPTLGLDGRIYVTSGLNGGKVTSPLHPERPPVAFTAADGRFDPATLEFESLGGRGQFGLSFDAFGRRFICSNRHPAMQVVLDPAHLRRNPHLAFAETVQNVSKVEADAVVWPVSRVAVTADFIPSLMSKPHTGTFTSACGVLVLGGTALGAGHAGNLFICEPAQNLVQRQVLQPEGVSFRSEPAQRGADFLASTDVWFRPVFLGDGPDGALYVADMYRREIDHPAYVPEEARGRLDFVSGRDRGRIYRVVREGERKAFPRSFPVDTASLVQGLEAPDSWWRERAQRLLVERGEGAAAPAIERVAGEARRPEARTRALWTLAGLGRLTPAVVQAAAQDRVAAVREQAVRLAATLLGAQPQLGELLVAAAGDDEARVRFVAALALGSWPDRRAAAALAALAARDGQDRWVRAAVLSGVGERLEEFRSAFVARQAAAKADALGAVIEDVGRLLAAGSPLPACADFLAQALAAPVTAPWRVPAVLGMAEGLRSRAEFKGRPPGATLAAVAGQAGGKGAPALEDFFRGATAQALDETLPPAQRSRAIAVLAQTEFSRGVASLGPLLDARQVPELQLQVVRAFERAGDARGGELLVRPDYWGRYTPQIREAVVAALVSKPAMTKVLFAAVRRGEVKAAEISSVRRSQLLKQGSAEQRAAAKELFQALEGGDRMGVYRDYRELVKAGGDVAKGAAAFQRSCSACHTFRGTGGKVGPDLSGVRNQPADALALHILVPNYEVAPAYQALTVTAADGRSLSGWLVAETESSMTLRTAAGTEETVLRRALTSVSATGVSLMPDGLEQTMTREEFAGLVAYLKADTP